MGHCHEFPQRFFLQGWDQARFISFSEKTYLVLSLNTIFIHFPVVLLNILIILMMFQLFWWDFPYTYGRGCQALSPFRILSAGVGVYCCLCTDADRHALNWDDGAQRGCDVCWFSELFQDIPSSKFMFWTVIFKRSIWLDLIGNLIGMEMFNIFQLSQYSTDFAWIGRMFSFVAVKESAPGHVVYVVLPHRHEAVLPVTRNLSRLVPWGHQGSPGQGWRWRNHWRIWHTLW